MGTPAGLGLMPDGLRLLLDEHYPANVAERLVARGVDAAAVQNSDLAGADDATVLRAAVADRRVVVTEDVNTFAEAIRHVPGHCGVVFVHPKRWPRNAAGMRRIEDALVALAEQPAHGLGKHPVVHWLT